MRSKIHIVISLILLTSLSLNAQGIQDSTFQIEAVHISADMLFKKEAAGMKESTVDSLVMLSKANVSLSDLLSENTPVFIKSHGRGALATASFRGTAASHTQVNWNGININSPMLGMVDFSLIPVYLIDDVSLKYGSSSIADQSGGLGGSININNAVDWNEDFSFKYLQGIGSYSTYDEFLSLGFGNKKVQAKTRIYHNYSKNDYSYLNTGNAVIDYKTGDISYQLDTNKSADYTRYGLLQEVYYRASDEDMVSFKYWGQYAQRAIPKVSSDQGAENSNKNAQTDIDHKLVADWNHYTEKGKFLLRTGYSAKDLEYIQYYQRGDTSVFSVSAQKSLFNSTQYEHNISSSLRFKTSLDANFHDVNSQDSIAHTGYAEGRSEISLLISLQKSINDKVNLNAMLRQDFTDGQYIPTTPYIGFDYKPLADQNIIIKGNAGRNYHQPSLNDLYWQPGGNPDLKPEEGYSSELGIEYQKDWTNISLQTELTGYYTNIDNWIVWVPNFKGYWEPSNVKNVISKGFEATASLNGHINKVGYRISGNYAYTSARNYDDSGRWGDESYGKQLIYTPVHSANLIGNISYKDWFITLQHNSYSELYTTTSNDVSERIPYYSYYMNDMIVGKRWIFEKIELNTELKVNNLFDENYRSVINHPMPGRNYMLMLSIKL